jgi:hypothetical protein
LLFFYVKHPGNIETLCVRLQLATKLKQGIMFDHNGESVCSSSLSLPPLPL